jgi:S1-C subfamily serine protease
MLAALLAAPASAEIPEKVIEQAKRCVVSIERTRTLGINGERPGRGNATGFIVDLERGLIATNRHVTGTSPAKYRIVFRDGSTAQARLLYYDPFNDFAFLKVSTDAVKPGITQAVFAPDGGLAEGSEVFLVGNNENYEYSVKTGKVVNLAVHKPPRQTLAIQTSFDRTGGASGSPVFDARGRVAAIHNLGSDTSSFEVPAVYLSDALYMLKTGGLPKRGEPWVKLAPVLLSDAVRNLKLSAETAEKLRAARPGLKRVLMVDRAVSPSRLAPGDIIVSEGGAVIGGDSYLFDKLADTAAGGEAELVVSRNGELVQVLTPVADAQALKVNRFITFSGGLFTSYTPEMRLATGYEGEGALLVRAETGSPFHKTGTKSPEDHRLLFTELNGRKITGLADLEEAAVQVKDKAPVSFISVNLASVNRSPAAGWINADLKFWPLKTYSWSQAELDWEVKP